ncbi:MAG TPA: sigma-70 family RNA polymerase sigma factor [Longimicrobium sp.]|nr:sigma-70 family RNA polymerase sigma factor [Longimicrobium sp.]
MAEQIQVPERQETAALVRAARGGDRGAFGVLYQRYGRMVHGLLLAHADADDVHDLVHDVFVSALEKLHTLRDADAFGAWIGTIARNRARMHHRSRRAVQPLSDDLAATSRADAEVGTQEVLAALRKLPERYREPLVLRLVEGMSGEEIARQTGLSHGTVRVYLHHGMAQLRELLGGDDA